MMGHGISAARVLATGGDDMQKPLRWLILAAFSAGLCIGLGQRSRTLLGILGLFVSLLGFLYGLCATPPVRAHAPVDVHETVVAETFGDITLFEAAALVGVLHEYRIAGAVGERGRARSLELHAAIDLVSRVSGIQKKRLGVAYRDRWQELRQTTAPRLLASLEGHDLVAWVSPHPEGG
jgi:hypothetical protein